MLKQCQKEAFILVCKEAFNGIYDTIKRCCIILIATILGYITVLVLYISFSFAIENPLITIKFILEILTGLTILILIYCFKKRYLELKKVCEERIKENK